MRFVVKKSLLDEDPLRQKPYAHVIRVNHNKVTGQMSTTKGKQHQNKNFGVLDWIGAYNNALREYATNEILKTAKGQEVIDTESWLIGHGLELATLDKVNTKEDIKDFLNKYAHAAFALGIHLPGIKGQTMSSPRELPKQENNVEKGFCFDFLTPVQNFVVSFWIGNPSNFDLSNIEQDLIKGLSNQQLDSVLNSSFKNIKDYYSKTKLNHDDQIDVLKWATYAKNSLQKSRIQKSSDDNIGILNTNSLIKKSSFVIPDYFGAICDLLEELKVWKLNK
jgi:hypothetical protein